MSFHFCHNHVDPATYFRSCVFDVCVAGIDSLCGAIQTYVSACQSANVRIYPWRQNTTCRLDCPANSHYELCGTDCGHTCASSTDATCEQVCSEGCFCDEGFFRSGTRCVPVESCGCQYDGFYYNAGQSFWTEGCTQRCECHAPSDLRCSAASCSSTQQCTIRNGQLGCFDDLSTCTVWGDPHYITFDHKSYDFQGTCRYVLATLCNETDGLHNFSVEAKNEPWRGSTVSITAEVFVNVWGYEVHMSRESQGVVKVNGVTRDLPVLLNGSHVSIYGSGSHTYLSADFGLSVKYDGWYTVYVSVPSSYRGKTCGLCGNFNGNPNDEFHDPTGRMVSTPDEFGRAWKVEGDYTCSDGCGSSCPECTNELPARAHCEVIQAADGPLSFCHNHVDPATYFRSCVFDVCVAGIDSLCGAIQTYVSACQSANVRIYPWRQNTTCRLDCPANSHYELCGTDCGHTCASSTDATCEQVCSEGCFCDEGFFRSGTRCVPVESCGCQYDGFYYNAGQSFWTEGCTQRCECHAPSDLRCSAASCSSTQQCTIRNGQLGCFDDLSTCTVWGDPHYITFDHKSYDFQGTCRYVLATLCNETDGLHNFSVEAKNEPWRGSTVSITAEVFVNVWGYEVHMSRESQGVVKVNGVTRDLPVLLNGSHVSIYGSGSHTYLSADFGLSVKYDGWYTVYVSVPSSYRGKTCGLCGNFNGNPNDEFHDPTGRMVSTPDEFGRAWKVEGDYTCSDGCGSSCPECTNELPARAHCEVIQAADGPLSFCHNHVDPATYFRSCVFDVCVAGIDSLCGAIQTYVSACQSANVRIYPWRQNTTCRLDCPANSHYELCGTDCGHTCASSTDATCEQVCSEGCFCDEGFFRSGTRCVPVESCGCQYDGFYYTAGQSFWTEGCTQRCECYSPSDLRCSAASCSPTQQCTIRNGQLGCFDDLSTCTVWGDPHYITFDGALAHFQGTCSYIITESVSHSDSDTQFQVVATNNHRGNNRVSFVSAVDIYLSNQAESVTVRIGPNKKVKVNGNAASLPTTVGTLAEVVREGSYIVVDAIDLIVQFDGQSTLLVRLGQHCQHRVTGMCGNFNNNPADDKVLPNGTMARNDNQFGHSWKSNTSQPGCGSTDDEPVDGPNDCPFREEYSELCSVITNSNGPFSDCHLHSNPQPFFTSCVYDLCLSTPANNMLCTTVSAYERTCSILGLNISEWRSTLQCVDQFVCRTEGIADIVILVDGSGSIGRLNFRLVRMFLENLVNAFDVGINTTRIGLVQYSGDPRIEWHLNAFSTKDAVIDAIKNLPYKGGGTLTGLALSYVMENSFKPEAGSRMGVPKIGIIITDGQSGDDVIPPSESLRNAGVELFAVGVNNANEDELHSIASDPDINHVYNVADFNAISSIVEGLTKTVCEQVELQDKDIKEKCKELDCTEYERCGEQDGVYGCFCDEHYSRPNNESYDSSITCANSSGTLSLSRCQLFEAGFHPSALHLRDDSCNGTIQDGRLVFHFNNDDQLCGTVLRSNGTHFLYENTIQGDQGLDLKLVFCCIYPLTQALSMDLGINPIESIAKKKLPSGLGHYQMRIIPFQDAGFLFPLSSSSNIEIEIDQRLYVEVRTEGVDERQISTIVDSCWATPVNNASYPVRRDLIVGQCPSPSDGTVEIIQNGNSTVARFSFEIFIFTKFPSIYLHCQAHLCLLKYNNCAARCDPFHNRVQRDVSYHDSVMLTLGPLVAMPGKYTTK
ncbi:IgGFc-binding protein-like [Centropristis striata]|uniref:IgGFc-binding protein-like n=1 Tax=Centropristis striata TaxID=184440 RepID=UPI0027E087CB|nr:IgGFc-binding protein-like [Centropristis striata]